MKIRYLIFKTEYATLEWINHQWCFYHATHIVLHVSLLWLNKMLLVRNLYLYHLPRLQLIVRPINEGLTKLAASMMPSSTGWVQSSVNLRTCFFFLPPLPVFCFFCFNNNNNTSLLHTCSLESFKLHSVLSHLYSSTKSNVPSSPQKRLFNLFIFCSSHYRV